MSNLVDAVIPYFNDPNRGRPIYNGYVWVGEPDTDLADIPANLKDIKVITSDGSELDVNQPLRTNSGGNPVYNGEPIRILAEAPFSILVQDIAGRDKIYVGSTSGTSLEPLTLPVEADDVNYAPPSGIGGNVSVSEYLDRQGIWASTEQEIQDANDYIVGTGKRGVINIPPASTIVINNGLTIDASYCSISGNGSSFNAENINGGAAAAITVTGTETPPYFQNGNYISNLYLTGTGESGSLRAFDFSTPISGGWGSSHFKLININARSFGVGVRFHDRAYIIELTGCEFSGCGIGLHGAVSVDGGENLQMRGGAIYNGELAIKMENPNGAINLFGTSIDYNQKIAEVTNGHIAMHGCHVEAGDYADGTPITIVGNGAGVDVVGGWWLLTSTTKVLSHWVDLESDCFFNMRGTRFNNNRTATDEFATGGGIVNINDMQSFFQHNNCRILHSSKSMLADGGFEGSSIVDDIFITGDTLPVVSRHSGQNINLSVSSDEAFEGTQSLQYLKTFGNGSLSSFALICVPSEEGRTYGGRYRIKRGGTNGGSVFIQYFFARIEIGTGGIPSIVYSDVIGSQTVNVDATLDDWLLINFGNEVNPAPYWATHFAVTVNGFRWASDGDSLYFDTVSVNKIG